MSLAHIAILKQLEGFRSNTYTDAGGTQTVGYGFEVDHICSMTKKEADEHLLRILPTYEDCVSQAVKVPLNENQFSALVIFCYNIGCDRFKKSTLVKKLNKGDYNSVPSELMRWNKVKGREVLGLTHRRSSEVLLWLGDMNTSKSSYGTPYSPSSAIINKGSYVSVLGIISSIIGSISSSEVLSWCFAVILVLIIVAILHYYYVKGKKL